MTGPWVTDTIHGHNEIHPAWLIERLASPTPAAPEAARFPGAGGGRPDHPLPALIAVLAVFGGGALLVTARLRRSRSYNR